MTEKVLLVWQELPEEVKMFELDGTEADLAIQCHGKFLNCSELDDDDPIYLLNEILEEKKNIDIDKPIKHSQPVTIVTAGFYS